MYCKVIFTKPITYLFLAADAELFGTYVPWSWVGKRLQHQSYHVKEVAGKYFKLLIFAIFKIQKSINKTFSYGINMIHMSIPTESSQSIQILKM